MADWNADEWLKLLSGSVTQLGVILGLIAVFVQQWRGQAAGKERAEKSTQLISSSVEQATVEAAKAKLISKSSDEKLDALLDASKSTNDRIDTLSNRMDGFEKKLSSHCRVHEELKRLQAARGD